MLLKNNLLGCLIGVLLARCQTPIKIFKEPETANYFFETLGHAAYNGDSCYLIYFTTYIDSSNGRATFFGIKTTSIEKDSNKTVFRKDTVLLKDTFYGFDRRECTDCSKLRQPPQKWDAHFKAKYLINDLGYLEKGQKQGWWVSYLFCEGKMERKPTPKDIQCWDIWDTSSKKWIWICNVYPYFLTEHYKDGLRDGSYIFYDLYFRTILYKTKFKEGTGYYKDFYLCEGMPLKCEGAFETGQKVGLWIYYDINGHSQKVFHKKYVP